MLFKKKQGIIAHKALNNEVLFNWRVYQNGVAYQCEACAKGLELEETEPFIPEITCVFKSDTGMLVPGDTNCENMQASSVLLPTSSSAPLHQFSREPQSQTENTRAILKSPTDIKSHYSKIYEGEMKKLKDSSTTFNFYQGKITTQEKKRIKTLLGLILQMYPDLMITISDPGVISDTECIKLAHYS